MKGRIKQKLINSKKIGIALSIIIVMFLSIITAMIVLNNKPTSIDKTIDEKLNQYTYNLESPNNNNNVIQHTFTTGYFDGRTCVYIEGGILELDNTTNTVCVYGIPKEWLVIDSSNNSNYVARIPDSITYNGKTYKVNYVCVLPREFLLGLVGNVGFNISLVNYANFWNGQVTNSTGTGLARTMEEYYENEKHWEVDETWSNLHHVKKPQNAIFHQMYIDFNEHEDAYLYTYLNINKISVGKNTNLEILNQTYVNPDLFMINAWDIDNELGIAYYGRQS